MHGVLPNVGRLNWGKGASTHVQRHVGQLNALGLQRVQHGLVKMQCRRGRGHRPGGFGKYGLVALRVGLGVGMGNVGRQWHVAHVRHHLRHRRVKAQPKQGPIGLWPAPQHLRRIRPRCGVRLRRQLHHVTHLGLAADAQMHRRLMARARQHAFDQHLHVAPAAFLSPQSGFEHLGIVEHQHVAGTKHARQLGKLAIARFMTSTVEQACIAPLRRRTLGNQLGRQGVIVGV